MNINTSKPARYAAIIWQGVKDFTFILNVFLVGIQVQGWELPIIY